MPGFLYLCILYGDGESLLGFEKFVGQDLFPTNLCIPSIHGGQQF